MNDTFEKQKRLEEQVEYRKAKAHASALEEYHKLGYEKATPPQTSAGGYAAGGVITGGVDLEKQMLRASNAKMSERLDEAARMADKVGCAVKTITRLFEDQHIGGKAEAEEQLCEALAMLTVAMRQAEQTMDEVIPF